MFYNNYVINHYSLYFVTFINTYYNVVCDTFQSLINNLRLYSYKLFDSLFSSIFTIYIKLKYLLTPIIKFPPLESTFIISGYKVFIFFITS